MNYYNVCNKLVENKMIKQGKITVVNDEYEYKVDFVNLIRNLKEHLFKMIINPVKEKITFLTSWIIKESYLEPNKIKKNRKYPRYKVKRKSKYSRLMLKCNEIQSKKKYDGILKSQTLNNNLYI